MAFFAFFKTLIDPLYRYIYLSNPVKNGSLVLDLGSGKGLFAGWQLSMKKLHSLKRWPSNILPPPDTWTYGSVEPNESDSKLVASLYKDIILYQDSDILRWAWKAADIIIIIDVMQYINKDKHELVLRKLRENLNPDGILLMRVADRSRTFRHLVTRCADLIDVYTRREFGQPISNTRSISEWRSLLLRHGFHCHEIPMSRGTPFANTLFIAKIA